MKKIITLCFLYVAVGQADPVTNTITLRDTNGVVVFAGEIVHDETSNTEYVTVWLSAAAAAFAGVGPWFFYRKSREAVEAAS